MLEWKQGRRTAAEDGTKCQESSKGTANIYYTQIKETQASFLLAPDTVTQRSLGRRVARTHTDVEKLLEWVGRRIPTPDRNDLSLFATPCTFYQCSAY